MKQMQIRETETVVQWNKIFKREVLRDVFFPKGKLHEDVYVIHRELYNTKKIVYTEDKLYYYVQRSNSIVHKESLKNIEDTIGGFCD